MGLLKRIFTFPFFRKGKKKRGDPRFLQRRRSTSSVPSWPIPRLNVNTENEDKQRRRNTSPPDFSFGSSSYRPRYQLPDHDPETSRRSSSPESHSLNHDPCSQSLPGSISSYLRAPAQHSNRELPEAGPSYTVTVHRKKLHAIARLDQHDKSNSNDNLSDYASLSSSFRSESPSPLRYGGSSIHEGQEIQMLREDSAVLNILKLYDKDGAVPAEAFSNSPSRPDFNGVETLADEKSHSEGSQQDGVRISIQAPGDQATELEAPSFIVPHNGIASVAPLNIISAGETSKITNSSPTPAATTLRPVMASPNLRLSSPELFDFLFSPDNNFYLTTPSHPTKTSQSNTPTVVQTPRTFSSSRPRDNASYSSVSFMDEHYHELMELTPALRSAHDSQLEGTSSIPNTIQTPHAASERVSDSDDDDKENRPPSSVPNSIIPGTSSNGSFAKNRIPSPSRSFFSAVTISSRASFDQGVIARSQSTSPSKIIENYAARAVEMDSEEEAIVETAIRSTWASAQLSSPSGSPVETLSPSSSLEPQTPSQSQQLASLRMSPLSSMTLNRPLSDPGSEWLDPDHKLLAQADYISDSSPTRRRLLTSYPFSAPSPHRGIVGHDGGSNREAFLYGQQDDEAFTRNLESHFASLHSPDVLSDPFISSPSWKDLSEEPQSSVIAIPIKTHIQHGHVKRIPSNDSLTRSSHSTDVSHSVNGHEGDHGVKTSPRNTPTSRIPRFRGSPRPLVQSARNGGPKPIAEAVIVRNSKLMAGIKPRRQWGTSNSALHPGDSMSFGWDLRTG